MKRLQLVGKEAKFKFESKVEPLLVICQSLPKAVPEDNWRFWLQIQWPSSLGSALAQLGRVGQTPNSGISCLSLIFDLCNQKMKILHAKKMFKVARYDDSCTVFLRNWCKRVAGELQWVRWHEFNCSRVTGIKHNHNKHLVNSLVHWFNIIWWF